jgi:hypothetical protein
MLGLVGTLSVVLLAMKVSADPNFWAGLFPDETETAETGQADAPKKSSPQAQTVPGPAGDAAETPLRPGEFRSRPDNDNRPATNPPAEDPDPTSTDGTKPDSATDDEIDVELGAFLFRDVKDNTIGIRAREADAYYTVLAKLRDIPPSYLTRVARQDIAYDGLMIDPEHHRGTLITVEGVVKRLQPIRSTENQHGVSHLVEAWIFTSDSGNSPYRVVCHTIPNDLPRPDEQGNFDHNVRVRVTGYFFKKQYYETASGPHPAPLILAKQLQWIRPRIVNVDDDGLVPYIIGFAAIIAVSLGFMLWRFSVSDKTFHTKHMKRVMAAPDGAIEALDGIPTVEMDEVFAAIANDISDDEEAKESETS